MGKIKELKHWKGNQKNSQTILLIFTAMYYMKKIFFLSLFIISGKIFAQVNLQSGSATFSLPMFNWQINEKGKLIGMFGAVIKPMSKVIIDAIEVAY